jgi:transposase-like protein
MSNLALADIGQDGSMSSSGPRAGGPTPRRSFTPTQKLEFLAQYEEACTRQEGGAFLREQGLYSSQITEWRKLRDAGVLQGKQAGEKIGKLSPEQAEIARLRRQLEVSESRLKRSEAALGVLGKLHVFLETLSEDTNDDPTSKKR